MTQARTNFRVPTRFPGPASGAPSLLGDFGGCFAPETLMQNLLDLESLWLEAREDPGFQALLADLR